MAYNNAKSANDADQKKEAALAAAQDERLSRMHMILVKRVDQPKPSIFVTRGLDTITQQHDMVTIRTSKKPEGNGPYDKGFLDTHTTQDVPGQQVKHFDLNATAPDPAVRLVFDYCSLTGKRMSDDQAWAMIEAARKAIAGNDKTLIALGPALAKSKSRLALGINREEYYQPKEIAANEIVFNPRMNWP
jgi:hypothetical protein